MLIYVATLFFVLTPNVLVSLPPGGNTYIVAIVHAVVFAVAYELTHKMIWKTFYSNSNYSPSVDM
jgi:uncharacterized membrane protein